MMKLFFLKNQWCVLVVSWLVLSSSVSYSKDYQAKLIAAIETGNLAKVQKILHSKHRLKEIDFQRLNEETEKKDTILTLAARRGNLEIVQEILKVSPNPDSQKKEGQITPLHIGAQSGHLAVTKELLRAGSDPLILGPNQRNILHGAVYGGNLEIVQLFLDVGLNVNQADTNDGETPLHIAAERNFPKLVKLLIGKGAEVDRPFLDGATALYQAAVTGSEEVVQILLENGANPNGVTRSEDDGSLWSPLVAAHSNSYYAIVDLLLKNPKLDFKHEISVTMALANRSVDVARPLAKALIHFLACKNPKYEAGLAHDPSIPKVYETNPIYLGLASVGFGLQCPICLEYAGTVTEGEQVVGKKKNALRIPQLVKPSLTPCGHVFCSDCLDNWIDEKKKKGEPVTCPDCRGELGEATLKVK